MRSYHTSAPVSRRKHGQSLHSHDAPKLQFSMRGDTLFRTIDDNARYLVRFPKPSLAVPVDVLLEAERRGVRWLLLTDEHGRQFRTPLDAFWQPPSFELDRGFGKQRALPLAAMSDLDAPEQAQQASLFEVYA